MPVVSATSKFAPLGVLVAHCTLAFINGFTWANYSPVPNQAKVVFDMTHTQLNWLLASYTAVWIPAILPSTMTQQRYGPVRTLLAASLLNLAGCALKLAALLWFPNFWWCLLGQTLCGASEVFFLSLPPLLASSWFDERHRGTVTAVASLSNSVGVALALGITAPIVEATADPRDGFRGIMIAQGALSLFSLLLVLLLPAAPAEAPSLTASKPLPLSELVPAVKRLLRHRNFLLLVVAQAVFIQNLWTFDGIFVQAVQPFGVSQVDAGVMTSMFTIVGALGQFVMGKLVDRSRDPYPFIVGCYSASVGAISVVSLAMAVAGDVTVAGYIAMPLLGVFALSSCPAVYEFVMEVVYPIPAAAALGINFMTPRVTLGTAMYQIASALLTNHPTRDDGMKTVLFFLCALMAGSLVMIVGVRNERNRLAAEMAMDPATEEWVATSLPPERSGLVQGTPTTTKSAEAPPV